MPRLSIVISADGSIEALEATLVSVLENRPADCEILVALAGPYSDPYDLKTEVCFVEARRRGNAVDRCNQALALARAPFIHLLSSGCKVTEGWTERALGRFGDRQVGSVAPLVCDIDQPERIIAAGVAYRPSGRRCLVGRGQTTLSNEVTSQIVGPSTLAAFYRASALQQAGGLSRNLGLAQADVDVALAMAQLGLTCVLEPQSRVLAEVELAAGGSGFRHALCEERLFWRNLPSEGRAGALAAHAGLVAWELALAFPRPRLLTQLAARAWACCHMPAYLRSKGKAANNSASSKLDTWRIDPAQPKGQLRESSQSAASPR